ncbi:hypothetical protein [Lysobacter gummosus]|uniref:hypothetical protein n=1 Tax=Lysobacter gummosus TaxID=262324 RepID=UPI003636B0CD
MPCPSGTTTVSTVETGHAGRHRALPAPYAVRARACMQCALRLERRPAKTRRPSRHNERGARSCDRRRPYFRPVLTALIRLP